MTNIEAFDFIIVIVIVISPLLVDINAVKKN